MQAAIDGLLAAEGAPGAPQPENAAVGVDAQAQALAAHLAAMDPAMALQMQAAMMIMPEHFNAGDTPTSAAAPVSMAVDDVTAALHDDAAILLPEGFIGGVDNGADQAALAATVEAAAFAMQQQQQHAMHLHLQQQQQQQQQSLDGSAAALATAAAFAADPAVAAAAVAAAAAAAAAAGGTPADFAAAQAAAAAAAGLDINGCLAQPGTPGGERVLSTGVSRAQKACNQCQDRKVKCNGMQPCANCVAADRECTYRDGGSFNHMYGKSLLEPYFQVNPNPSPAELTIISTEIGEEEGRVGKWFSRRRKKAAAAANPGAAAAANVAAAVAAASGIQQTVAGTPEGDAAAAAAAMQAQAIAAAMQYQDATNIAALQHAFGGAGGAAAFLQAAGMAPMMGTGAAGLPTALGGAVGQEGSLDALAAGAVGVDGMAVDGTISAGDGSGGADDLVNSSILGKRKAEQDLVMQALVPMMMAQQAAGGAVGGGVGGIPTTNADGTPSCSMPMTSMVMPAGSMGMSSFPMAMLNADGTAMLNPDGTPAVQMQTIDQAAALAAMAAQMQPGQTEAEAAAAVNSLLPFAEVLSSLPMSAAAGMLPFAEMLSTLPHLGGALGAGAGLPGANGMMQLDPATVQAMAAQMQGGAGMGLDAATLAAVAAAGAAGGLGTIGIDGERVLATGLSRATKACNECRRRKVKCNGVHPCVNCVQANRDCTYREGGTAPASASPAQIAEATAAAASPAGAGAGAGSGQPAAKTPKTVNSNPRPPPPVLLPVQEHLLIRSDKGQTGFKGVRPHHGRFQTTCDTAHCRHNNLGTFGTAEEAAQMYLQHWLEAHPDKLEAERQNAQTASAGKAATATTASAAVIAAATQAQAIAAATAVATTVLAAPAEAPMLQPVAPPAQAPVAPVAAPAPLQVDQGAAAMAAAAMAAYDPNTILFQAPPAGGEQ